MKRCRCYRWPAKGTYCQQHAGAAAGWELRPGLEGPLSKQDSRPVESITQLISRKSANGKRNFPSHSEKSKKICGHFRELLMETDGDVSQEVERSQLGEHPPCKETPQRVMRTVCPREPAEIFALRNSRCTNALHFPSFLILPLFILSSLLS